MVFFVLMYVMMMAHVVQLLNRVVYKALIYKDLKSLIDQRFEEKYSSENYKISHPDKVIKNPLYYYNDYGITHLWRAKK